MKIVFSTDQVYLHGGIEKVIATKANYFSQVLKHDVVILTTEQNGKLPCYELAPEIRLSDLAINYDRSRSYFHPSNFKKAATHLAAWRKFMRSEDPDILISCNYAFDYYWLPFLHKRTRKLKEFHSSGYAAHLIRTTGGFAAKLKYALNDFINSKFERIVLLNPSEKEYFPSSNTVVIPNSISASGLVAPLRSKRAIAAGRIAPVKNFAGLIRIWRMVADQVPDFRLDIFGSGSESDIAALNDLIVSLDLGNVVHVNPATSKLAEEMASSSVYVMTSESECYPMVLLEALSVGLPVVSFDCPTGPKHIVTDGSDGLLVPHRDEKAFAEKIVSLAADTQGLRMMGDAARVNSARFGHESVMPLWITLFDKLSQ